jgi:predicted NUDIX family NTP pyrophosphohydrolase
MKAHSAGLLVFRRTGGQPEVLLAHNGGPFHAKKDLGSWTIPKGLYEENESPQQAARREFEEEIGQPAPEGELIELGQIEQKNNKSVLAWAVEGDLDANNIKSNSFEMEWPPKSGKIQEFPEVDRAAWFSLPEAAVKLIPAQAEFLQRLAQKLDVPFEAEAIPEPPKQNSLF